MRWPSSSVWLPSLAWILLITFLSSRRALPGGGGPLFAFLANLAHAPLFGLLALWLVLLVERRAGWPDLGTRARLGLLLIVVCIGAGDELHQGWITGGRDMSAFDLLTDVVGASAVLGVVKAVAQQAPARRLWWLLGAGFVACIAAAAMATWGGGRQSNWISPRPKLDRSAVGAATVRSHVSTR